jgi:hypothetical protein
MPCRTRQQKPYISRNNESESKPMKTVAEHLNRHFEEEVLPPCLPDMSNAPCKLAGSQSQSLNESIASQQTLRDKTKTQATTTADAERLAAFMRLPVERQNSLLGLDGADKDNDDWGNSYAARNRASHKAGGGTSGAGDLEMKKLKKENLAERMKEHFPEMSDEARERIADMFLETAETVSARSKLAEMAAELYNSDSHCFSLMFADDQTIDAVELLSNKNWKKTLPPSKRSTQD